MFFSISLYVSLAVFAAGTAYRVSRWFRACVGPGTHGIPASRRVFVALRATLSALFSRHVVTLARVFVLDVLLQLWLLKKDFLRWLAHILIYGGFMLLLGMHGLEKVVTGWMFSNYQATLNPFLFLRDLFAAMVLVGVALAFYRRCLAANARPRSAAPDYLALIALLVIMVSGVFLEGVKMTSYTAYEDMVSEYAFLDETEDAAALKALEAYWAADLGVVVPGGSAAPSKETLMLGRTVHEQSCASCHSDAAWAFLGYGVAKAIRPVAGFLDRAETAALLDYIHFLACFVGLAWLPFSKFFHMVATPVNLLAAAVCPAEPDEPAAVATRRAIELDACTHCGDCTLRCSVSVAYRYFSNVTILPSEKLAALRAMASDKGLRDERLQILQQGSHICTDCHRCTDVCPVGINLQALWDAMRRDLAAKGYPKLEAWARQAMVAQYDLRVAKDQGVVPGPPEAVSTGRGVPGGPSSVCFGCQACSTICPVVAAFEDPEGAVGLMPHQIMHALALGRTDLGLGSRMVWDCVTCYLCQEYCPQGVQVTDVLYDLKNKAFKQLGSVA